MFDLYNLTKVHTSGFKGAIEVCDNQYFVSISIEDKSNVKLFEPKIVNSSLEIELVSEFCLGDNPSAVAKIANNKFVVGCNSGSLYAFAVENAQMQVTQQLNKIHSSRVCFLSCVVGDIFASCSWDHKINLYQLDSVDSVDGGKICFKFSITHHSEAVWCCSLLSIDSKFLNGENSKNEKCNLLLSGGADATICAFTIGSAQNNTSTPLKTLVGHTQPVRSVVCSVEDSLFVYSCSNDFTLRKWDYNTGSCLLIFPLNHFLYSVNFFQKKFIIVTQEEGMAVVTTDFYMEQQFEVKKNYSVWSGICFENPLLKNTFAVCCDSGEVFVYGRNLSLHKKIVSSENDILGEEKNTLLDDPTILNEEYALSVNGTKEGEVKLARDTKTNQIKVYQWSDSDKKWELVGDALNKKEDEKKSDMTIDVEIPDDSTGGYIKQKLFVNRKDDPWEVANNFIMEHGLQSAYLEQIAVYVADKMKSELGAGGNFSLTKKFEPILIMTRSDKFQFDIMLREIKKVVEQSKVSPENYETLFQFIERNTSSENCAVDEDNELDASFEALLRVFEEATGNFLAILDAFRYFALKGGVSQKNAILQQGKLVEQLSKVGLSNEKCQIMHLRILWNCVSPQVDNKKILDLLGVYEMTEKSQMELVSILNNVTVVMNERKNADGYVDSELLKRVFLVFGRFVEGVKNGGKCAPEIAVRMLGTMNNICCLGVEFQRREDMIGLLKECCSGLKGNEKIQRVLNMLD